MTQQKPEKMTLVQKRAVLVELKQALSLKIREVIGQLSLIEQIEKNGCDLNSINVDTEE